MAQKLKQVLWDWELTLAIIALVVMTSSVSFGVASRYITATSATWAVELANLSFTWVVFLGAAAAFRRGLHVRVDMLVRLLSARVNVLLAWVVDLLVLGFLGYVLYLAAVIAVESWIRPSPVLRIPFTYVYAALVLSLASMLVHHVRQIVGRWRPSTEGES